ANSLEGNAYLKASYIYNNYHLNCFADDTGLEIEALNNEPGVFSARYAGENKSSEANMLKVLSNLESKTNRKAQFRTIVSLIISGKEYRFEGIIKGEIIKEKHGNSGFGYDPIFMPDGYNKTFAELGEDIKNKISHRAIAINKLCEFLKTI
ncbi:MAG: RdgB/HAM1 family non-canonical purine NTP pyrophosphatase, partial [Bacteroidaceae bacterium]